jgi:hypothetical protein
MIRDSNRVNGRRNAVAYAYRNELKFHNSLWIGPCILR